MKKVIFTVLAISTLAFTSCKKDDLSNYATKTDLSDNKIENITLTIHSYQWTWNSLYDRWEYSYPHSNIGNGALLGYVISGNGKEALPYYDAQTETTFGLTDASPLGEIIISYYDGTSTLDAPAYDEYVYLKVIPSGMKKPNVDYTNFKEVEEAYK